MHGRAGTTDLELDVLTVEISLTRRPNGFCVARVSYNEQPGWESCEAPSAQLAFERATTIAARRVTGTLGLMGSDANEPLGR
jgi:hypothetical protein